MKLPVPLPSSLQLTDQKGVEYIPLHIPMRLVYPYSNGVSCLADCFIPFSITRPPKVRNQKK